MKLATNPFRSFAAVAALSFALQRPVGAQCNLIVFGPAPAGAIPASGTGDGAYPLVLPSAPLAATLVVAGSSGTSIDAIVLRGLTHTWIGDVQFVLQSPSGSRYNLLNRLGDFSCDFSGDYTIVGSCSCTGYGQATPGTCTGPSILPPGRYAQSFGDWISGTNGIDNTPLESIPAANGAWTLLAYDWAGGDMGTLTSWDIAFKTTTTPGTPPAPPTCCDPLDNATVSNPVTLSWGTCVSNRATTHKVRYKRGQNPSSSNNPTALPGLTSPTVTLNNLRAGWWHWDVASAGAGTGYGPESNPCRFCIPESLAAFLCVSGGPGGSIPSTGTGDGTWPSVLPSAPFVSTYNVVVPSGATEIVKVDLIGATHTWIGDLQFVLTDPTGTNHNLLHRIGHTGTGFGLSCDLNGTYSIAALARIICPRWTTSCSSSTVLAPEIYAQDFTSWPSGTFGIFNTPLESIPVSSGVWTLTVYDWVGGDSGALTGWQLCFGNGSSSAPVNYCTSGTTTNGCNASISASAQPSASLATSPVISVANVEGQKQGLLFYGVNNSGFSPSAWASGSSSFLCVKAPTQRTGAQSAGGTTNTCDGSLTLGWNAFVTANPSSLGQPFASGAKVYMQAWFRDPPAAKTTNLSDAVELTLQP